MSPLIIFVIAPLACYVVLFSVEAVWSVRRLLYRSDATYFQTTWEITHTLLIFGVNSFLWLYSKSVPLVADRVATTLLIAALFYILRTVAYIRVFYGTSSKKAGWAFAITNCAALVAVAVVVIEALRAVDGKLPAPNAELLPYLWPGLIFVTACCAVPLWQMYASLWRPRAKKV